MGKEDKKAKKKDSKARTASAAVFFNENKSIAGFGNSMRAVFTSVRELVENSLDASEKRSITPIINFTLRRLNKKELTKLMGTSVVKSKDTRLDFIEITCKDNGVGVPRELIPQLFGTVLAGTKYGAQQTRGRFGLGSKMVLLYAMSTLDLPIQITTRPEGENITYRVKLFINLEKNAPIIVSDERFGPGEDEFFEDFGTEIKVSFTGSWNLAKTYVREYFKQLAIITPYADIYISLPGDEPGTTDDIFFQRVVDDLPKPPEVVKIHPWGTDISTFRRELSHADEDNLIDFLTNNFMGVQENAAKEFFEEVGVDPTKPPSELTSQEIRRIVHDGFNRALKESKTVRRKRDRVFKFDDPKGDALSPLGANRLRKGLEKELNPEFVSAIERTPRAYEGHPFIIEAAIGYGGGVNAAANSKGVTVVDNRVIYRYANRIPLIFGAGSDLISNQVNSINWSDYGLTRGSEPLAIAVSLVSTKIPFPETSKEYIDKVDEIGAEIELVLKELGRRLKTELNKKRRRIRERQRKSRFEKYAPNTVTSLLEILEKENIWNKATGVNPSRIIAALSSGIPRIDSSIYPPGINVFSAPIWSQIKTQEKLQSNKIHELSSLLRTDNKKIAKILGKSINYVDIIKRRTIRELDIILEVPPLDTSKIVSPDIERRFYAKDEKGRSIDLLRLTKALQRRWIRNAYDYLVSPHDHLLRVQGLAVKLVEAERVNIIKNLYAVPEYSDLMDELSNLLSSGTLGHHSDIEKLSTMDDYFGFDETHQEEIELVQEPEILKEKIQTKGKMPKKGLQINQLIPMIEILWEFEPIKKRKITTVNEFLLETTHPSNPINEKLLAPLLVQEFKANLIQLIAIEPEIASIRVDVSSQEWIDGYLRNAFKRRNISTISDLLATDDSILVEIGEFQRTLYNTLRETLIPKKGIINANEFITVNREKKIKILKAAGIDTIEKFASTTSDEFMKSEKLQRYIGILLEESKDTIIEILTMRNQLGSLQLLKEIPQELETSFIEQNILNTTDLFIKPFEHKQTDLRERVNHAIQILGRGFSGFTDKQQGTMEKAGILTLDQLVLNPDYYLRKKLTADVKKELEDLYEILMLPVILISPNLIPSMNLLNNAGVNSLGKFLIWPSKELARITNMTEEWLRLVKQGFRSEDYSKSMQSDLKKVDTLTNLINKNYLDALKEWNIDTIAKAVQIKWGDFYPKSIKSWKKIAELNELMLSPIHELISLIKLPAKKQKKYVTLFGKLDEAELNTILEFSQSSIDSLKSKLSTITLKKNLEKFYEDLFDEKSDLIDRTHPLYKAILSYRGIERIQSPIVYLSEFNAREIDLLSSNGIKTLNQLTSMPIKEIAGILKITQKKVKEKFDNSKLQATGTPIAIYNEKNKLTPIVSFEYEGTSYFTENELKALYSNGYDTLESLFYIADRRIFEVSQLNWEVVNHFNKLLRSPPVLISWKKISKKEIQVPIDEEEETTKTKEKKSELDSDSKEDQNENEDGFKTETIEITHYFTFSSKELEKLTLNNINRVIDFVTEDVDNLCNILEWDKELIEKRQKTIVLQEVGIGLEDLNIFRPDHIAHLNELGLITIEDLYFSTSEETWDSPLIPYESIKVIKNIVNLSLANVVEELGEEFVDILMSNEVDTILDLLLTGDPILEQKTGLPAERFENLKFALDFGALIQVFDKSILFTPGILFHQAYNLMNNGYHSILDLLLTTPKKLARVLDIPTKEVKLIINNITRSSILNTEEERGVLLKDLNVFTRSDLRSVMKSGIFEMNELDTLQEALYQITADMFQGEDYLLEQVLNLQKVCKIPLSKIGDINQDQVTILKQHHIITIADALMISFDDLPTNDNQVSEALNYVSRSIQDLSPFVALARLPAHAVIEKGENDNSLIEVWMENGDELHERTMRNIRSLLSMPVRFTSYYKSIPNNIELNDLTIADVLLQYTPEDHPCTILRNILSEPGAIIRLMDEGATSISLLDINPKSFRNLMKNGLNSVEKILLVEDKNLSSLTGYTQKYWKQIKELFDPEVFKARVGDIGIPVNFLTLTSDEIEELNDKSIKYLDQIIVFSDPSGVIKRMQDFLFSSTIFLAGSPGEREIAENSNAKSIIEGIIALRETGADLDLIIETVSLGWQAYLHNQLKLPENIRDQCTDYGIKSIQDLVQYILNGDPKSIPQEWLELYNKMTESSLLLPVSYEDLVTIVHVNRCSTIIDALTSPMLKGKMDNIRSEINTGNILKFDEDLKLSNTIIKKLSTSLYKRIETSKISLQDIVSSPKTLQEFKGINQKYLHDTRQLLKIPLTRLYLPNSNTIELLKETGQFYRLDDVIFKYAIIARRDKSLALKIKSVFESEDLIVIKEIEISDHIKKSLETALNIPILGFHDFWAASWQSASMLSKIDSIPSQTIKKYLKQCFNSLYTIDSILPNELWQFKIEGINSLAELLLTPERKLIEHQIFTRKRIGELQKIAIQVIESDKQDPSYTLRDIAKILDEDPLSVSYVVAFNLFISRPHPLLKEIKVSSSLREKILTPINFTELIDELTVSEFSSLFSIGIYTILDLILAPTNYNRLPKKIQDQDDRIKLLSKITRVSTLEYDLTKMMIPNTIKSKFPTSKSLNQLIFELFKSQDKNALATFTIPIQYIGFENDINVKLERFNVTTLLDVLIIPPDKLSLLIGKEVNWLINFIENLDITELENNIARLPLRTGDLEQLSRFGNKLLLENNIFSLLDLKTPFPSGLNRNDENQLYFFNSILNADISLLFGIGKLDLQLFRTLMKKQVSTLRELFRTEIKLPDELNKYLRSMSPKTLAELPNKQRKLATLEIISNKDEKLLYKEGIFTIWSLSSINQEKLSSIGIKKDKAEEITGIVNLDYKYINNLPSEIIDWAKKQSIKTIGELLTINSELKIEFPIRVNKPQRLDEIYSGNLPDIFKSNGITTLDEFLSSSKIMKLLKQDNNNEVYQLIAFFHTSIEKIKGIQQKWIPKLQFANIFRVWQYLQTELTQLSSICNSSTKVHSEIKSGLILSSIKIDKCGFPTNSDEDEESLSKFGLCDTTELVEKGLLTKFIKINKIEEATIRKYIDLMEREIWHFKGYWNLDREDQAELSKYDTYTDFIKTNPKKSHPIVKTALTMELIDEEPISNWINDLEELEQIKKLKINNIHKWLFTYYRGQIDQNTYTAGILKGSLDMLPSIEPKNIFKALQNNITCVIDVILHDDQVLAKKLGTTKAKIVKIKSEIPSLSVSEKRLPNLGLISSNIVDSLRKYGFKSWAQIFGNLTQHEINNLKGISSNTLTTLKEISQQPIHISLDMRELGLNRLQRLSKMGITTFYDMLILGEKVYKIIGDEKAVDKLFSSITKGNLNKGMKHKSTKLSLSRKIKIADVKKYNEMGITTPIQILIHAQNYLLNEEIKEAVSDWVEIGNTNIEFIDLENTVIAKLKQQKINILADMMLLPNHLLRDFGLSNAKISKFRDTLFLLSKSKQKEKKKSLGKKEKKSTATTKKKVPTKKKATTKKKVSSAKSSTKKSIKKPITKKSKVKTDTKKKITTKKVTTVKSKSIKAGKKVSAKQTTIKKLTKKSKTKKSGKKKPMKKASRKATTKKSTTAKGGKKKTRKQSKGVKK